MSESSVNYGNIDIRIKDSLIIKSFDCDFSPVAFSFNPERFSAKLLTLVSEMLGRINQGDPGTLNAIAEDSNLSIDEIRNILESYILKRPGTTPPSAIEKFMEGRNLVLEGSVQQIVESLPAGIVLMLTHLAAAALIMTTDVANKAKSRTLLIDHELWQLIDTKFKDSVNQLWERSYEKRELD